MKKIAVLFCRSNSIYKKMRGVDVWDAERDALKWEGGSSIVAHPPCGPWGRLRQFCKASPAEKALAIFAVGMVQKFGGVLEHPASSTLWKTCLLPRPGHRDGYGGFTFAAPQFWWGHKARKNTWFYIVGIEPAELPQVPFKLGEADFVISTSKKSIREHRKGLSRANREGTPLALAAWLVETARRCRPPAAAVKVRQ